MNPGTKDGHPDAEAQQDIEDGTRDASERAEVSPLTEDDLRHLFEIVRCPDRTVGVEKGKEVVLSYDSMTTKIQRAHISFSQIQSLQVFERALGADTLDLSFIVYSFKPVKPIVAFEKPVLERIATQAQALLEVHFFALDRR